MLCFQATRWSSTSIFVLFTNSCSCILQLFRLRLVQRNFTVINLHLAEGSHVPGSPTAVVHQAVWYSAEKCCLLGSMLRQHRGQHKSPIHFHLLVKICWKVVEIGWILKRRDAGDLGGRWWEAAVGSRSVGGMSEGYNTGGDNESRETWETSALQGEGGSEDQRHFLKICRLMSNAHHISLKFLQSCPNVSTPASHEAKSSCKQQWVIS